MLTRKNKLFFKKIASFFSVIRGYNIVVLALSQYLAAIFILAPKTERALHVILDVNLFILVLATSISVAGGYIINNFYDSKKDLINRPRKSMIDRLVSQATKLKVYFAINFLAVVLASIVSVKAALFYSVYIFLLWFYSHKVKRYAFLGNTMAALLSILPFFGILMYYKVFGPYVFVHAFFLYLLLLLKEITKDLENLAGDLAENYQTLPVKFGENFTKYILVAIVFLIIIPVYLLINYANIGQMQFYFYGALFLLLIFLLLLFKANKKYNYVQLHFLIKIILVLGVISIVLIEPEIVIHGKKIISTY